MVKQRIVIADDDPMAILAALKHQPGRLPNLERQLRRDQTIGTATNPVRTEIFAAHMPPERLSRIREPARQNT